MIDEYSKRNPASAKRWLTPVAVGMVSLALDAMGGVIPTLAMARTAQAGLRFAQFHRTALYSPTRAALSTGRNHQSVGYETNWLPVPPSGMFNLTIRIYNPKPETFDPSYKFSPIERVD